MANLVFTPEGGAAITFLPAGDYVGIHRLAANKYYERAPIGGPGGWGANDIEAPAVDDVDVKFDGYRGQPLGPHKTVYVADTRAAVIIAVKADLTALRGVKDITVTIPDDADYPGCILDGSGMQNAGMGEPQETESGKWMMDVIWLFENKRLS